MYNAKTTRKKTKGFTLIEVIIAVSIVVILASLVVPKVAGYIDRAKDAKILNSGKQIYTAAIWSYSDQGNTFDATKIKDTITKTVGVSLDGTDPIAVDNTAKTVTIKFVTDSIHCSVLIDQNDNSYDVKKNETQIFSSN